MRQDSISAVRNDITYMRDSIADALGGSVAAWPDTLCAADGSIPARAVGGHATAEAIFGASSSVAGTSGLDAWLDPHHSALIDNVVFKLSAIACFIAFCLLVYLFRNQIATLSGVFRGTAQTEKILGQQSRIMDIFLGWAVTLGLLVFGMTAVRFIEAAAGEAVAAAFPQWALLTMTPAAWAICALVFGYQFSAIRITGALTLSTAFASKLFYLKKTIVALAAILLTPALLLFALSTGMGADIMLRVVSTLLGGIAIFSTVATFNLFMRQNISISLWFLYLCSVEIFPISLVWIIAARSF